MNLNSTTPYEERHLQQRLAGDADQAEFRAVCDGSAIIEEGIYDDRVAGAMDDFAPGLPDLEPWQATDLETEAAAGGLLEQIEMRQRLLGRHYPFKRTDNTLAYEPSKTKVYEFCLAICNATNITSGGFVNLPREFEQISRRLTAEYLGEGGRSHHTGWPRQSGVATNFREMMESLSKETKEWQWHPEDGLPSNPSSKTAKDEGIDFVAWKPQLDQRVGQLFIIGQCACGDDWTSKFHDTQPERLAKWFRPMTFVPPVKAFCTPRHVVDAMLREASREAGLVFDRIRLTLLAEKQRRARVVTDLQSLIDMVVRQ